MSCGNNNDEIIEDPLIDQQQYNVEGNLLEAVIDESLNVYEFFAYDENRKPMARFLGIPFYHNPNQYNDLKNGPLYSDIIHYYVYDSSTNRVQETRIFYALSTLLKFENGRVFLDNIDISDDRTMYQRIVHQYENGLLSKLYVKNFDDTDEGIQNFHYNTNSEVTSTAYQYEDLSSDYEINNFVYVDNRIHSTLDNGDLSESYYLMSNNLNPYYKLLTEFGIATHPYASTGKSKPPYGTFFKYFSEKYFFVTSSSSYFIHKNDIIETNNFNYPIKTIFESEPLPNIYRTELIYTYLK